MSTTAFRLASQVDRIGLRRPLAAVASLAYRNQSFCVDGDGFWVNRQAECTIVSPTIHTSSYQKMRDWVIDTWCYRYQPSEGDVVVDVGSGVGEEAVTFSHLVGATGQVVAIEAHPVTFDCLTRTIVRSNTSNVVARQCAVTDVDGEVEIGSGDNHLASSLFNERSGYRVPARSLDSLANELGLAEIAFLKMNIEGAERLAMPGMRGLAARIRNLCISCHDFIADQGGGDWFRTKDSVLAFLQQTGFDVTFRAGSADMPWRRDYLYAKRL